MKNLIALTQGASIGDQTSLEELVGFVVLTFLTGISPTKRKGFIKLNGDVCVILMMFRVRVVTCSL